MLPAAAWYIMALLFDSVCFGFGLVRGYHGGLNDGPGSWDRKLPPSVAIYAESCPGSCSGPAPAVLDRGGLALQLPFEHCLIMSGEACELYYKLFMYVVYVRQRTDVMPKFLVLRRINLEFIFS